MCPAPTGKKTHWLQDLRKGLLLKPLNQVSPASSTMTVDLYIYHQLTVIHHQSELKQLSSTTLRKCAFKCLGTQNVPLIAPGYKYENTMFACTIMWVSNREPPQNGWFIVIGDKYRG